MEQERKLRVGLIYGGKSGEHEVSLSTAFAVMGAMDYGKYEILPFYITKKGEWRVGTWRDRPFPNQEELMLESFRGGTVTAMEMLFAGIDNAEGQSEDGANRRQIDVAFPLLHGTNGEDGTIQGLLEMADIPYVGAGVLASSVGMDKAIMKQVFAHAGLPQCKYEHFLRWEWDQNQAEIMDRVQTELGYPCFVKPANLGSSVGISKARDAAELKQAIEFALQYDRKIIIEEFVDAREVEVSVLGNDEPQASIPGEIISSNEFYDYKAKYIDGKSEIAIPAPLDEELLERIREMALQAYRAIDGSGLSRVDFFVRRSDMAVLINEVNTMPGFTPISMYPILWQEMGITYPALLERLILLALERFETKQKLQYENV
ncbi:D-alanine--D-alanine ligase [Paenibacillus dendritiformis]|uniref:D-alanine--D-alanine ligase n=1 Tax=Paenibacillus dendritiformis TaxID=130049 RepID=UPI00248C874E|nr:D-alanine--D-alanine ligase [Paenibacillus dendritiformis]WGU92776.1 D-alanine--D-alanine ligase [Paenibacillus dendritiformis]